MEIDSITVSLGEYPDIKGCHQVDESFGHGFSTKEDVFSRCIEQNRLLVAKKGMEVIGYLRWGFVFEGELPNIQMIRIKDGYRRKGLGSRMMAQALKLLKEQDYKIVLTSTDEGNGNTPDFYTKNGFKPIGRLTISDGEPDEIFLAKRI